ncbi:MAG: OmpA family protein [Ignavibacteria bacterium]|jgi:outer membrane protein OmpA-like peptidoglycan-associated protein
MRKLFYLIFVMLFILSAVSFAQFKGYGVKGGAQFNGGLSFSELSNEAFSFLARGFVDVELHKMLSLELGVGYGRYGCHYDYVEDFPHKKIYTDIIPIDLRLKITPFNMKSINPYGYIGLGALNYSVSDFPTTPLSSTPTAQTLYYYAEKRKGWTGVVPVGLGVEIKLAEKVALDINSGFNFTGGDAINNIIFGDNTDHWAHLGVGFVFGGPKIDADEDRDGLKTSYEERIGTDPLNPDTDGDGLKDGDEVLKYKTNPLKADTDEDGLTDYDEVMKYSTDPTKADTEGDGLKDGEEVTNYKTSPLNPDTDGDGLSDYQEVKTTKTDPLKADTDGDGLNDGAEVNTYKTNPLVADTDGGSVNDGIEVDRNTNPLDPSDDVEKKVEEKKMEVGEILILEGVNFETSSANLTSESEEILQKSLKYILAHPTETYEISGHTDSRGTREKNIRLSKDRAESVKSWLVKNGIDANRLTTEGYGPDKPIAPNDSQENMYKNRRVEFKRIK